MNNISRYTGLPSTPVIRTAILGLFLLFSSVFSSADEPDQRAIDVTRALCGAPLAFGDRLDELTRNMPARGN